MTLVEVPIVCLIVLSALLIAIFIMFLMAASDYSKEVDKRRSEHFNHQDTKSRLKDHKELLNDAIMRRNKIQKDYNNLLESTRNAGDAIQSWKKEIAELQEVSADREIVVRGCIVTLAKYFMIDLAELKEEGQQVEELSKQKEEQDDVALKYHEHECG